MKKTVIILGVVIVILLGILAFYNPVKGPTVVPAATSTAGIASLAVPTVSSDGHVVIAAPLANGAISSPVAIAGSVTGGGWFFEGSFPIKVLDGDGTVIGSGTAQTVTPGDWTSTGTVPFTAKITFAVPKYATGSIVFANDNPSGDPANASQFRIPVSFK